MKKNQIETIVLIVGIIAIGLGAFLLFTRSENPQNVFAANITFAVGFLFYIVYSTMTTASLQKDIRTLNAHVEGLKQEIERKARAIQEVESRLSEKKQELESAQAAQAELNKTCDELKMKIQSLESEGSNR